MAKGRRQYTLEEYSALKSAYGGSYKSTDIVLILAKPFFFIAIYTFFLYYYWWLSLAFGVLASLYQYRRIMILNARREFEQSAFNERNKFINNLSQILSNPQTTTIDGLHEVKDRMKGEFRSDLTLLLTQLSGANPSKITGYVDSFKEKYEKDVIFSQYMDQIATALMDGRANISVLKDIRAFHNHIKTKRDYFLELKAKRGRNFTMTVILVLLLTVCLTFGFGYKTFIDGYAHTILGWIGNTLFLAGIFLLFTRHLKRQEDDNVLEVDM